MLPKIVNFIYLYILLRTLVYCERTRHNNHKDYYDPTQEKTYEEKATLSCPNCLHKSDKGLKDDFELLRLEAIKRQILSKLGLSHKPNVTHAVSRELVEKTFRTISGDSLNEDEYYSTTSARSPKFEFVDADEGSARTSEIIAFAEQGYRVNGNRLLEFQINTDLGNSGHEYRVKSATLWMKADLLHSRSHRCRTDIYVFKFKSLIGTDVILTSEEFDKFTDEPTSTSLEESKSGWQKVDVTKIVEKWLKTSKNERLKLFVDCSCCSNWQIHRMNKKKEKRSDPNRPFMVIEIDPATTKRVRRTSTECSPDIGNQCCKQSFYVNFEQLGWREWIIAPKGYHANYCKGECGYHRTPDTYVTYHTHVIEQFRKNYHLSGMQPCCAPLKFSSVSLIYYDMHHNIIKRDLPKMVVDECGCP